MLKDDLISVVFPSFRTKWVSFLLIVKNKKIEWIFFLIVFAYYFFFDVNVNVCQKMKFVHNVRHGLRETSFNNRHH